MFNGYLLDMRILRGTILEKDRPKIAAFIVQT
jgi:hypothetical protein